MKGFRRFLASKSVIRRAVKPNSAMVENLEKRGPSSCSFRAISSSMMRSSPQIACLKPWKPGTYLSPPSSPWGAVGDSLPLFFKFVLNVEISGGIFLTFVIRAGTVDNYSSIDFCMLRSGAGQRRSMFIQTQSTPNPSSLMFYPGKPVMEIGSADFPNARVAMSSPLAKSLFAIDGTTRVFFGSDFVTVTKSDEASWDYLKPEIFAAIMDFYTSGNPVFLDASATASKDTAIHEDDSEIVAMIKELLETRIRPAVQDDGGDIEYCGFDEDAGIVKLRMQGACSGCPSSSVTLKTGIENMLMHYVPEVKGVEQELDNEEEDMPMTSQAD
ncbi:NifU-like protein 4, mitochondrial [Apostasia shenzhenica]|uniref:NifU-like protein 4, mitochondrial n=1 Tax=Apostasia shenzhenica TaxID=1088818 RepID=A0A2I0BD82_9ASPA|nr:NifU-like protein 4, mitochondrial [Apostasia shenzhenica]